MSVLRVGLPRAEVSKVAPARRGTWGAEIWRHRHFYLFISPFFLLFAVFGLYPLLFSLYLSFVKWDGLTPMQWVGLANFRAMLDDELLGARFVEHSDHRPAVCAADDDPRLPVRPAAERPMAEAAGLLSGGPVPAVRHADGRHRRSSSA